jgi:uncharacterized metal-binding protein
LSVGERVGRDEVFVMSETIDGYADKPLIYACSGCSSAAQLANHLALRMDRGRRAEMSCIVGLGGDVKPLVRTAKSGRPIVMLDGCPLRCGQNTLERHGLRPALHWDLSRLGVAKEKHVDFQPEDAARLEPLLAGEIAAVKAASCDKPAKLRPMVSDAQA